MNQKEEIRKQEKELSLLEHNLLVAEEEFKERFSDLQTKIDTLEKEWREISSRREKIKLKVAEVLSTDPKKFVEGYVYRNLNQDIKDLEDSLNSTAFRKPTDIVWERFNNLIKTNPDYTALVNRENEIRQSRNRLEEAPGYQPLTNTINTLKHTIKSKKSFIENLNRISYFRQYAKEAKQREQENAESEENKKKQQIFFEWFDKNYLPKLKQAVADACKEVE